MKQTRQDRQRVPELPAELVNVKNRTFTPLKIELNAVLTVFHSVLAASLTICFRSPLMG